MLPFIYIFSCFDTVLSYLARSRAITEGDKEAWGGGGGGEVSRVCSSYSWRDDELVLVDVAEAVFIRPGLEGCFYFGIGLLV